MVSRAAKLIKQIKDSKQPRNVSWDSALQSKQVEARVGARVLAEALFRFHEMKDHENVIEGIEAALRNNKGQPWMYGALAQAMKIADRPQKQIDRVLLSRVDFTVNDEAQILVAAALLGRFDAYDQAIKLCKEAIKQNPWQPATWGLARRLAMSSKSVDEIIWSHCGTLEHVWHENYKQLHSEVEAELEELQISLRDAGKPELSEKIREAVRVAKIRDLRIRLKWIGDADIDLSIVEPGGKVCSYKNPITANGGMLILQSDGGEDLQQNGRSTEEYVCVKALPGEYRLKVNYISGRVNTGRAVLEVVRHEGSDKQQKQSVAIDIGERNADIPLPLKTGRAVSRK